MFRTGDQKIIADAQHLLTLLNEGASVYTFLEDNRMVTVDLNSAVGHSTRDAHLRVFCGELLKISKRLADEIREAGEQLALAESLTEDLIQVVSSLTPVKVEYEDFDERDGMVFNDPVYDPPF